MSSTVSRTRNFTTVVYPESAPENWLDILSDHLIPCFVSPLHNEDKNPTGELKKAHFHVVIMFDSVKTMEQALEIVKSIGGVGCETVKSIRGVSRYLCHLDNPEKAQYSTNDVRCLCGADYFEAIALKIDKYLAIGEMEEFCEKYDVVSFFALSRYASLYRPDWSRALKESCAFYMERYLKSRKWSKDNNCLHIVDKETGEMLI